MGKEDLNSEFKRCIEKGKIIAFRKGISLVGKEMRESADYRYSFSREGADNLIKAAEDFLNIAKKSSKE